jgi:hypothetical protein
VTNATSGCVAAIFEINGNAKPNKFKTDVVAFNANGLGSTCAIEVGGKCFGAPFSPTPLTAAECNAQKDELGIKECYWNGDYWAGAVAQCGGVKNMPTLEDLAKIVSAIYDGNPSAGAKQSNSGLTYTSGTATALGLPEPTFYLWSGEESSTASYAFIRYFNATSSQWGNRSRYNNNFQALCLSD